MLRLFIIIFKERSRVNARSGVADYQRGKKSEITKLISFSFDKIITNNKLLNNENHLGNVMSVYYYKEKKICLLGDWQQIHLICLHIYSTCWYAATSNRKKEK